MYTILTMVASCKLLIIYLTTVGYSSAVYTYTMVKEAAIENFPTTAMTVTTMGYSGRKGLKWEASAHPVHLNIWVRSEHEHIACMCYWVIKHKSQADRNLQINPFILSSLSILSVVEAPGPIPIPGTLIHPGWDAMTLREYHINFT